MHTHRTHGARLLKASIWPLAALGLMNAALAANPASTYSLQVIAPSQSISSNLVLDPRQQTMNHSGVVTGMLEYSYGKSTEGLFRWTQASGFEVLQTAAVSQVTLGLWTNNSGLTVYLGANQISSYWTSGSTVEHTIPLFGVTGTPSPYDQNHITGVSDSGLIYGYTDSFGASSIVTTNWVWSSITNSAVTNAPAYVAPSNYNQSGLTVSNDSTGGYLQQADGTKQYLNSLVSSPFSLKALSIDNNGVIYATNGPAGIASTQTINIFELIPNSSTLPPVPEPDTDVLAALGIGLLGWAGRRQRTHIR